MTTQTVAPEAPHAPRVGAGLLDPRMLFTQLPAACAKLDPRTMMRNPVMFVVEVGAALSTGLAIAHPSAFAWLIVVWLWATVVFANLAEAVAEGRGKAQAAALRRSRQETNARLIADGGERLVPSADLKVDDLVVCEAGDLIPSDGDVIEGIASVDESAITGESAPVIREAGGDRSRGHRRHPGALGPDRRPDHREAGRDLPGPDDRAGRGRGTAEDPERDRPEHPAGQPDDHLPAGRGDAAAARDLQRGTPDRDRPGLAAGLPDPDHDRSTAERDRHRRHGPARPAQRAGDVGARRRGRRRRQHPAAGQDRHDHARQPRGGRAASRWRASTAAELADAAQLSSLADETPGGPLDRRPRQARVRPARPPPGRAHPRHLRPVQRPDPDERLRPGRERPVTERPQGRDQRRPRVGPRERRHPAGRPGPDGRRDRRWRWYAAGGGRARRRRSPGPRRRPPQGHRQERHARAVRRAAPDGHPHRDDHRRQPADRQGHRRRGGRRRLPGRGQARGQAGADPHTSRRAAGWSR